MSALPHSWGSGHNQFRSDHLTLSDGGVGLDLAEPSRADVRFARPNIQIHDAHVVDLYQWVSARYLVGIKGAET